MKVSTEKAGVVKLGLVSDFIAEFAGCVVRRDRLVEGDGIGLQSNTRVLSMLQSGCLAIYSSPGSCFGSR